MPVVACAVPNIASTPMGVDNCADAISFFVRLCVPAQTPICCGRSLYSVNSKLDELVYS